MMFGSLHDQVAGQLVANAINPMNGMVMATMRMSLKTADRENDTEVVKLVDSLVEKIGVLQKANADPKVIAAYQRMIDKHTS
jgi:hypothetical protein